MSAPNPVGPSLVPPQSGGVPPRSSNNNLGVWIACGVGVVLLFALLIGLSVMRLGLSFARNVSISSSGKSVEISTPGGKIAVNTGVPADIGLPVYPGAASSTEDGSGSVEFVNKDFQRSGMSVSKYLATDSIEKVDAWYRQVLGSDFERQGPGPKTIVVHGIVVEIEAGDIAYLSDSGNVSMVALKPLGHGVEIDLAKFGKQNQAQ